MIGSGRELTGSSGEQQGGRLGAGQLMQKSGRRGVEQLGIIDRHHQPPFAPLLAELADALAEHVEGVE